MSNSNSALLTLGVVYLLAFLKKRLYSSEPLFKLIKMVNLLGWNADVQSVLAMVFIVVMSILLYFNRSKLQIQKILGPLLYFAMLRTSLGLKAMDWLGTKFRKPFQWFGVASVIVGFAGMGLITYQLIKSTIQLFVNPAAAPGIQPVLPFAAKGVFFVPFSYWIISIFVIAVIHEFAHGVLARAYNMNVKSSGFAFLGAIVPVVPAAFVEPDEEQLKKRSAWQQLSVFAAGPGANIFMAIAMIFVFGIQLPFVPASVTHATTLVDINELGTNLITFSGFKVTTVEPSSPADGAGIRVGQTITALNGVPVSERDQILETLASLKPGQTTTVKIGDEEKTVVLTEHPSDATKGYLGIQFDSETVYAQSAIDRYGVTFTSVLYFLVSLTIWVFLLSLGIGLFNLIPLGPIDGGRMFKLALERLTGSEENGARIWKVVSYGILGMILVNLVIGFVG